MKKKSKKPIPQETIEHTDMVVVPKLTRQQYLEWRTYIYAIDIEKFKLSDIDLKFQLKNRDVEIAQLRAVLLQKDHSVQCNEVDRATKAYLEYREKLGHEIGVNMEGAIIDPITLEVKLGGNLNGSN